MFIRRHRSHLCTNALSPTVQQASVLYTTTLPGLPHLAISGRPQRGRRAMMAMASLLFAPGRSGSGHAAVTLSDAAGDASISLRRRAGRWPDGPERQPPERPLPRLGPRPSGAGAGCGGLLLRAQHVPHHLHVLVPAGLHVLVKVQDATFCIDPSHLETSGEKKELLPAQSFC